MCNHWISAPDCQDHEIRCFSRCPFPRAWFSARRVPAPSVYLARHAKIRVAVSHRLVGRGRSVLDRIRGGWSVGSGRIGVRNRNPIRKAFFSLLCPVNRRMPWGILVNGRPRLPLLAICPITV